MSGHNLFWLCGLKAENALTLYSPFCHENAAGCTNLHRSANDIATMNIRIYEVVSGYIAGSAAFPRAVLMIQVVRVLLADGKGAG